MAASIDDYAQTYQQALTAYAQQQYEEAAILIDEVVQNLPHDPNTHLLRGHVYYVLQQFDVAKAEYQQVLELTEDVEITAFARTGIDSINQYQSQENGIADLTSDYQHSFSDLPESLNDEQAELEKVEVLEKLEDLEDLAAAEDFNHNSFDFQSYNQYQQAVESVESLEEQPLNSNPFDFSTDINDNGFSPISDSLENFDNNPFASITEEVDKESEADISQIELDLPGFWQEDISISTQPKLEIEDDNLSINHSLFTEQKIEDNQQNQEESFSSSGNSSSNSEPQNETSSFKRPRFEDETLLIQEPRISNNSSTINNFEQSEQVPKEKQINSSSKANSSMSLEDDDSFDMDVFESAFGSESFSDSDDASSLLNGKVSQESNIEFLDDFDEFDDLGNIQAELGFVDDSHLGDSQLFSGSLASQDSTPNSSFSTPRNSESRNEVGQNNLERERDDELFSITGSQEAVPIFTQSDVSKIEPQVNVEQGLFAFLENAPLVTKQWMIAGAVGVVSAVAVATVTFMATTLSSPQQRESVRNTGWAMALAAGIAGSVTAGFMGNLSIKQMRRTTKDLQAQFDAVRQGNLNVQATVYSEDELGKLAAGFNEMARVIFTTTNEATRKAQEQEEAKENLQRQVIRLLDDVEGAARGDLTVQAEVTADVLGAVADAFNLTIQNLRDIVQQVKVAAREVTKGSTNSETFARALSSDALRQAEELAVTLNSVQVMTDSIQRVAEAAREAEAVARDASMIAVKGGEAVENTVAGILEIRETVAETTRKVKRLAESSQEISKIVALISQIASRTNLLALNASIEAARAGEAGRGFAIVADEVRQLADRSAKSLKEIEEIVRQIQSETSSVMTAMEEGTQQVIKGTVLAEEAKRSLENIIQVANRIDILVRSITTDTVEQTETSRAVAQVMQSVELTAQETSQEAQRVSGALQHLVGVSRDLISSVERFRVETTETR